MAGGVTDSLDLLSVPPARRSGIERLRAVLRAGQTVALSTHINADGDGCGSEAALAHLLTGMGMRPIVVNPTPWPDMFRFLLDGVEDRSPSGTSALKSADALVVLDISDVKRLGILADTVRSLKVPVLCIDHHQPSDEPPGEVLVADTSACATGELVYDVARVLDQPITAKMAVALYTALLTDTGGFRFSNTSPRCHTIAGQLLAAGVDPEEMYRRVYASMPVGRLHLLREALETLGVDTERGISWLSVDSGALDRHGVRSEDLDGIVEHARSIAGTRLALLFRDLGHNKVKVSFRSTSGMDVHELAKQFGGGGHKRAAGAMIPGSIDAVREQVVAAARTQLDRDLARTEPRV